MIKSPIFTLLLLSAKKNYIFCHIFVAFSDHMNFIILVCLKIYQLIVLNFVHFLSLKVQRNTDLRSQKTNIKNHRQSIKMKIHFHHAWSKNSISNGLKYLVLGEICPVIVHFFCQENRDHQATANDFIDIYLDEVQRVASFSFQ